MSEENETDFKVVDKRGAAREEPKSKTLAEGKIEPETAKKASSDHRSLEEVNFVSFLLSLYSSALAALGKVPNPTTGKPDEHIEAGKQMIDILTILLEKTKGNLTSEESQLLDNILYELRMIYLEKSKKITL